MPSKTKNALTRVEKERLKWSCRRGLLELDLLLHRFIETNLNKLSVKEGVALARLLSLPDNDIWDLISGRLVTKDDEIRKILSVLDSSTSVYSQKDRIQID